MRTRAVRIDSQGEEGWKGGRREEWWAIRKEIESRIKGFRGLEAEHVRTDSKD